MASKHVFPLFLDGKTQTVTASESWDGVTSFVAISGAAGALTVGDAEHAGTMLTVLSKDTNANDVNFTTAIDADANSVRLDAVGELMTAMWNGSAWVVIGAAETALVS